MHSNPDKSGHDYAADYSFRDFQRFIIKTPRLLKLLQLKHFLTLRAFFFLCFRDFFWIEENNDEKY